MELIKDKLADSLKFYYVLTLIPLLTGATLAVVFYVDNGVSTLEGISSAFVTSISGLSIREIINRRDRISFLDILVKRISTITDVYEIQKINTISWSIIESTISKSQLHG